MNDIAVLKLKTPLQLNKFIQRVKLPKQGQEIPPNSRAILIGWGQNAVIPNIYSKYIIIIIIIIVLFI